MNDNRNYDYGIYPEEKRPEYDIIAAWVPRGATVVDLGCGNGALMQLLQSAKQCSSYGIELSDSGVKACRQKGLQVQQGSIDSELPFPDDSFDIAICNVTIQMVLYPEILLKEMKRVSRRQIISFPNFAYFKNRLDLLLNGRMPRQLLFGYKWYNTGHIHQCSVKDFHELVKETGGLGITRREAVPVGFALLDRMGKWMPNLFSKVVIIETVKN
ncbi:MAG TPA: methionine biosynthesis protein MetW [Chitinophagaceae bacterium]